MPTNRTMRPATPADAPALAVLDARAFQSGSEVWSVRAFAESLSRPETVCLLVTEKMIPTAYVLACRCDCLYILKVAVRPDRRGTGLADALLDRLFVTSDTDACLEVRVSNHHAIALYTRMGFEPIGRRPQLYADPTEDGIIMQRRKG
ncbi:MAG: N-acetyltransferase [Eubacteriales bacterium]|nr:N-acetyltransferase [Eubacteriales bacterium]